MDSAYYMTWVIRISCFRTRSSMHPIQLKWCIWRVSQHFIKDCGDDEPKVSALFVLRKASHPSVVTTTLVFKVVMFQGQGTNHLLFCGDPLL
ncbi:hypothetical protein GDO81_020496 [Engystomops pustulosus]|uniref:Uncharacterized protein n=1 Tax=Engystomops pustulosus TaxID=76066 RepID=A0AAV6ZEA3_ENGPU|nr:hypothetical protein GDO81_020496 [Engystomops pustulosus]